jgi:uncharacterized protein
MTTEATTTPSADGSERIHAVDAVRGFALAGVALVHMIEQYMGAPMPEAVQSALLTRPVDKIVMGLDGALLMGKFYVLFSLLFGLSFFIQMDRAAKRGVDFSARFVWRLGILFGIGFAHHLFYRADILTTYAVLGALLIVGYRVPSRWLLGAAIVLFLGLGRFVSFAAFGSAPLPGVDMSPAAPWVMDYYTTLRAGSILDVMSMNALGAYPGLINFQFGVFGRGYVTLGLFLLGLWIGRQRFFEGVEARRATVKRGLRVSLAASAVTLVATGALFATAAQPIDFETWQVAFALTAYDLFNLAFAGVWLFGFLRLWQRQNGPGILRAFAPFGRMALTNYVFQGVLGAGIYYGWGLGRLGVWRPIDSALAGLALIGMGMLLSRIWLTHFQYGPLEWLWRSLTHMKTFPLRRLPLDAEWTNDTKAA